MYNFSKNQKIVIIIIAIIIIASICYYVYSKDAGTMNFSSESLEIEENITKEENDETEEENTEEYSDQVIVVDIKGAVNKPGVYELKINSRIIDAIEKAEGTTQEAAIDDINLAYKLEDGMKIYIPTVQEYAEQEKQKNEGFNLENITKNSGLNIETDTESNNTNIKNDVSKVNINTATQTELETLPGIGPSTSSKIIEYRQENGKFKSIDDLKNVSGIGDVKFENRKDKIEI